MASIVTLIDVLDDIPIALWAQEHCPSFTGWIEVGTDYRFYFDLEQDSLNFIMRWQGQYESI